MSITTLPNPGDTSTHSQSEKVRAELKAWEKSFAAANEGRKAGREDIKKNSEIAEKYRLYSKLRETLTSATSPSFAAQTHTQSQGSSSPSHAVPSKKRKRSSAEIDHELPHSHTKSRHRRPPPPPPPHPAALDDYDPPSTHLTPVAARTFVGPTPQKNGLVMGLFDLLSPRSGGPPSKSKGKPITHATETLQEERSDLLATPSKPPHIGVRFDGTSGSKSRWNPDSATQRRSSAAKAGELVTPSARRTLHLQGTPASRVSRLQFGSDETPEFLRRTAPLRPAFHGADSNARNSQLQDAAGGHDGSDEVSWSPVAVRLPRKPAGRSLSALVRGLRNMAEEALDDDLDLLREMESEELGAPIPTLTRPRVHVPDSQAPRSDPVTAPGHAEGDPELEMPLGADGERDGDESSESEVEPLGRDGRKLRVWRKKGQKRSTRRVVMRPTVGGWKPEAAWVCGVGEEGPVEKGGVGDTQRGSGEGEGEGKGDRDGEDGEGGDGEEADGDEGRELVGTKAKGAKKAKKGSATAHANFRALKIRNKQSKGKRSGGGFGRRNK